VWLPLSNAEASSTVCQGGSVTTCSPAPPSTTKRTSDTTKLSDASATSGTESSNRSPSLGEVRMIYGFVRSTVTWICWVAVCSDVSCAMAFSVCAPSSKSSVFQSIL